MTLPIVRVALPSGLVGVSNGQLRDDQLVAIPGGRLFATAARAWAAMVKAAAAEGIVLKPTSSVDTYRDLAHQTSGFQNRYVQVFDAVRCKGLDDRGNRNWKGVRWYLKKGFAAMATPGTSNHGLGLAIDVDLTDSRVLPWLLANAQAFGFSWESQDEAWHIRYVAGNITPRRVLEVEGPEPVSPPAPAPASWPAFETIRKGSKGPAVVFAQKAVNIIMGDDLVPDGDFGNFTAGAVRNLQRSRGLYVDGVIGPKTWAYIFAALTARDITPRSTL